MPLKPPIPRMNSPNKILSPEKGCAAVRSPFLIPTHEKGGKFMLQFLSQKMKPHWKRALSMLLGKH